MLDAHCLSGLKAARQRAGIEPADLAAAIGCAIGSYYRFENGSRRIYLDKAHALARLLKCSVDDLAHDPTPLPADNSSVVATEAALTGWVVDA